MSYCNFSSLILSSTIMTTLYTSSISLFRKRKALTKERVVSMTKNEYGLAVKFLIAF